MQYTWLRFDSHVRGIRESTPTLDRCRVLECPATETQVTSEQHRIARCIYMPTFDS